MRKNLVIPEIFYRARRHGFGREERRCFRMCFEGERRLRLPIIIGKPFINVRYLIAIILWYLIRSVIDRIGTPLTTFSS